MSGGRETRFSARRSLTGLTKLNGLAEIENSANLSHEFNAKPAVHATKSHPVNGILVKLDIDEAALIAADVQMDNEEKENINRKDPIELCEPVIKDDDDNNNENEREQALAQNPYSQMDFENVVIKEEPIECEIEQLQAHQEDAGLRPGALLWAGWSHNSWFPVLMVNHDQDATKSNQIRVKYFNYNGMVSTVAARNVFDFSLDFEDEIKMRGSKKIQKLSPKTLRGVQEAKVFSKFDVNIRLALFDMLLELKKKHLKIDDVPAEYLTVIEAYNEAMQKYDEEVAEKEKIAKAIRENLTKIKQEKAVTPKSSPLPSRQSQRQPKRKLSALSMSSEATDVKPIDIEPPAPKKRRRSSVDTKLPLDQRFNYNRKDDIKVLFKDANELKFCMECYQVEDLENDQEVHKCMTCPHNFHIRCADSAEVRTTATRIMTGDGEIESNKTVVKLTCKSCKSGRNSCFLCSKEIVDASVAVQCDATSKCERKYHEECLKKCPQSSADKQKCPQHSCHTCFDKKINRSGSLVKCIKCPAAYHGDRHCFPAGSQIMSSCHIICPRHKTKEELKKKEKKSRLNACIICHKPGNLVCCEECPQVVHSECALRSPDTFYVDNDKFMCVNCQNGQLPLFNTVIWCKVGAYRWWPAYILTPQNYAHKDHQQYPREFCVKFFGTDEVCWTTCERVFEYTDELDPSNKSGTSIDEKFKQALREAKEMKEILFEMDDEDVAPKKFNRIYVNRPVAPVKLKSKKNDEKVEPCTCNPSDDSPCSIDSTCIVRALQMECPSSCPAEEKCQNQKLQKREYAKIVIKRTRTKGFGAFAKVDIPVGTIVSEYVGELINKAELDRRRNQKREEGNGDLCYFMSYENDLFIDAEHYGNKSRFINHSCDPNCDPKKVTVDNNVRIAIISNKLIKAGEELSFDYEWSKLEINTPCSCGTAKCSGFIGGALKKEEIKKEAKERKKAKAKRRKKKRQSLATPLVKAESELKSTLKGRRQSSG